MWPEGPTVHPGGEYVYVVNTGDDSLSVAWVLPHHQSLRAMVVVAEAVLSPPRLTGPSSLASPIQKAPKPILFTNHRDTEECFALKFEIGPLDSPPYGRVPCFETQSTKQIEELRN